jgi:transposase
MNKRIKYDYKFRLQCVEAVVKSNRSVSSIAEEKGIERSNLRLWIEFYRQFGKEGLKARKYQYYDISYKIKVIQTIEKELLSLQEACVRFEIPSMSTIISWQRSYKLEGIQGLNNKPKGRPPKMKPPIKRKVRKSSKPLTREQALLEELEYLRAENALLKKLQALVQTDKKQKPSSS